MQYRVNLFFEIAGMLFLNLFELLGFWVIFRNIPALDGWNYEQMIFMYGFLLIATSPSQLFLDNGWTLPNKVVNGEFLKYCFRPINILFYV